MRRTIPTAVILSACAIVLASCGKDNWPVAGRTPAIKLTVSGVKGTKAPVITIESIKGGGFNISAYVTETWKRDVIGASPDIDPGIFKDPGYYYGPYDEDTYPVPAGIELKDILVTYVEGREDPWRITGNDGAGYANHKFSWVNGVAMNFFSYAPVSAPGRVIEKEDNSVDSNYPFSYTTPVTDGVIGPSDCADLIFAFTQHTASYESDGKLKTGSKDMIDIHFYHALAQILFCVNPADFPTTKLVSVKLLGPESPTTPSTYLGIPSSGSCIFAGSASEYTWDRNTFTNPYPYRQTFNGTTGVSFASGLPSSDWEESTYDTDKTLYSCIGDVLFVIPQTLSECAVEVCIQEGTNPPRVLKGHLPATTSGSTDVSWEAGKYYKYKIGTTGESDNLSLSMTLADWAEREDYIPIF